MATAKESQYRNKVQVKKYDANGIKDKETVFNNKNKTKRNTVKCTI
jgi:hypothetical protein